MAWMASDECSFSTGAVYDVLTVMLLAALLPAAVDAEPPLPREGSRVAQLGLPLVQGADWRQWDSFLTNVVKKLGDDLAEPRREQLRELFLDSRYQLVQTVSAGGADPVPRLFVDTWNRLGPVLKQALPELPPQTAGQYAGFVSAMDAVTSLGGVAERLGVMRVTPDALRRASAVLGTTATDPLEYTVDVDAGLRALLGFSESLPAPRLSRSIDWHAPTGLATWFLGPAFAADADFDRLNRWVPSSAELPSYLAEVRKLLTQASAASLAKTKLAPSYHALYRHIVYSAAWQESCWRQFVRTGERLTPLASATGDVGMMQVNRNTWRGVYDLNGLSGDIAYNTSAGSEILLYYLSRFAIRKKEDAQPGGHLARATYSAYNGGPRQLGRYRNAKTPVTWKRVDDAFWTKFRAVSAGQELGVRSCYAP
jgi:hypothetical protein